VSLEKAWLSAHKEIKALYDFGYHDLHKCLPFLPIRDEPQGSTPRKHEIGRNRRTSDRGFPHRTACFGEGICAVSLNDAIGLHSDMDASGLPKRKAPKIKPRIEGKVWGDSTLLNAGLMILKEPMNWFTEDFADYFNQIPYLL
jgi:hypothetical protein